jgi:SAM-dependent methyltransferase
MTSQSMAIPRPTREQRLARWALAHVRHPSDRRLDTPGQCNVCGSQTRFVFNRWVIPDDVAATFGGEQVALAYRRRESLFCRECGSSHRVRRFAAVLLEYYGDTASCFAELVQEPGFRALRVAEINGIGSAGSMHAFLSQLPNLVYSEYLGADRRGEVINGIRNEDLHNLTYSDSSFDLVLTSDTLEHVPDLQQCVVETRRVLGSGGRHILTVPVTLWRERCVQRARLNEAGAVQHLTPAVYHGRGGGPFGLIPAKGDYLAFTDIGADFEDIVAHAGFTVERHDPPDDSTGASSVYCATAGPQP